MGEHVDQVWVVDAAARHLVYSVEKILLNDSTISTLIKSRRLLDAFPGVAARRP
jgi:hypothetical protein